METRQQKVERLIDELDVALRDLTNAQEAFEYTWRCGKMLDSVDAFFEGEQDRMKDITKEGKL